MVQDNTMKESVNPTGHSGRTLEEKEQMFQILFQDSMDAVVITDKDGGIEQINHAALDLFGYSREEFKTLNFRQFYAEPGEAGRFARTIARRGYVKDYHTRLVKKDGGIIDCLLTVSVKRSAAAEITGYQGIIRDFTQKLKSEKSLKESEIKYRSIFENTGTATVILESDATISMANSEFENLSGYMRDDIEGKMKWTDFVADNDLVKMKQYHEMRRQGSENAPSEYEFLFIDRHGGRKYIMNRVALIPGTNQSVASLLDISRLKEIEAALKKSEDNYRILYNASKREEELYRSLLQSSADPIVIYDMEGRCKYVNTAFTETFGWAMKDLEGQRIPFVPDSEKEQTFTIIEDLISHGTPCRGFETKRYTRDGEILEINLSASRYLDHEENPAGMLVILRNISEEKALRARLDEAQKMDAISTLAGGVAHEFNNALSVLSGNLELLEMELPAISEIRRYSESMNSSISRMKNLTNQLLAYARGGKYQPRTLSVNDLIDKTIHVIRYEVQDRVTLEVDLPREPLFIHGDPTQLQMALSAVIMNGSEAIESEGSIKIKAERPGPEAHVCINVMDDGKGMDDLTVGRVFDPFFSTKFQGRGLGMAAVYGIVKNHDGHITIDSAPGKGSSILIQLPLADPASDAGSIPRGPSALAVDRTILVIEDEKMVMQMTRSMLEKLGYDVLEARTGKEAIEIVDTFEGPIDLVVLDIVLPDMPGRKIYEKMTATRPELKTIVCSGYSIDGPAKDILDAGAQAFLQKPFKIRELSEKIEGLIET